MFFKLFIYKWPTYFCLKIKAKVKYLIICLDYFSPVKDNLFFVIVGTNVKYRVGNLKHAYTISYYVHL